MFNNFKLCRAIIALCIFIFGVGIQYAKAQATVYFFLNQPMPISEYPFEVNGSYAFSLEPYARIEYSDGITIYSRVFRKVIFKETGKYTIATNFTWREAPYHIERILNLEDGETYYVLLKCNAKGYRFELITEKEGLKLLEKAKTNVKYVQNPDYIYGQE